MGNQEIIPEAEKLRNQNTRMLLRMTRFRTCYPKITVPWHSEYFKLKKSEKGQVQEGLSDLLFYPEADPKTLM